MKKLINPIATVTIMTTDPMVFPIIRAKLTKESENLQVHAHFFCDVKRVEGVLRELIHADTKDNNNEKVIWVLRENEISIVSQILSFQEASIITSCKKTVEDEFMTALKFYPYIALPFQTTILKQVAETYKSEFLLPLDLTSYSQLNETEKEIIYHLYKGQTTTEIAQSVCISYHTVNNNIASIKKKLKVNSKVEIIKHIIKTTKQTHSCQKDIEKLY
ncbi:helix-turn-helix transcriptional regulator [Alkalihalophilus pseudofirmus]|uniref:helix-turn-helix transcriptional regulator n=1 Tax=Alkalihalophilus pseudofirmus TaxID=79885 RepID=UPI00259AFACB|nr:helix-turn-helix transcriptional regulator [Alkalihalophilus pseudofirmus]WEG16561.1 helix-turn-helix transcriptional regulator [Alkalihalophilus pseudofirmus]